MKKIGLCVCYDTKNYGSQLQVLATQLKVKDLGYDYEIIRYKKKYDFKMIARSIPRLFNPLLVSGKLSDIKKRKKIKQYTEIYTQCAIRNTSFSGFIDRFFDKLSPIYYGYDSLKNGVVNYEAFLVGSDQLWLPSGLASGFYTLGFVPDNYKKIAYATSFGVSEIPCYQKKRTRSFLDRFDYLSSREIRGVEIIKELTGKEVPVVVDPTLLLTQREWDLIIPFEKIIDKPYIFCYFLGTNAEHRKVATHLSEITGFPIVTTPFLDNFVKEDMLFGDRKLMDIAADDFVNLIRNAEYVLTDSFHGSVFSIINRKKFMTFNRFVNGSGSRNSRIDSLCNQLGLEARRYQGEISAVMNEIDYDKVNCKLFDLRTSSLQYLKEALLSV